jgi:hypothetical protein
MSVPREEGDKFGLKELSAKRDSLIQSNQAQMQSIAQLGAELDPAFMNRLRIDTLAGFIFTRLNVSPEERLVFEALFEVEFQERVAGTLKSVKEEVRKASFGLGAAVSPEQIRDLWRRQQRGGGMPGFGG